MDCNPEGNTSLFVDEYKGKQSSSTQRKNLIIWDWDDTIFPTYSFRTHQDKNNKDFMGELQVLVLYIERVFTKMIKLYGASNIIIVTNASPKWINMCLNVDIVQELFIKFQNILKTNNIKTISASRPDLTDKYPHDHCKWKEIVFKEFFEQYFDDKDDSDNDIHCITSIGDSLSEYKASHSASKYLKNRVLNRFLFKSNPSINDMIFQLKDILTMIEQIGTNLYGIDIDYSSFKPWISYSDTTC